MCWKLDCQYAHACVYSVSEIEVKIAGNIPKPKRVGRNCKRSVPGYSPAHHVGCCSQHESKGQRPFEVVDVAVAKIHKQFINKHNPNKEG